MEKWDKILTEEFLIKHYTDLRKSACVIAKENKCGKSTVFYYLIKYNISIRTKSEANKYRPPMINETRQKIRRKLKN